MPFFLENLKKGNFRAYFCLNFFSNFFTIQEKLIAFYKESKRLRTRICVITIIFLQYLGRTT